MGGTLSPAPWFVGLDDTGVTLPGAKLFTYASGTSTKQTTYSDAALTVPNANPIILDAAGRAVIYLSPSAYKFVLAPANDTDPPTSPIKTVDPVGAVPSTVVGFDVTGRAGENINAGDVVFLADGLSGGLTAGSWYKTNTALGAYANLGAPVMGMALSGGFQVIIGIRLAGRVTGLVGLTTGLVYYLSTTAGSIASLPLTSNARVVGVADSTTTLILAEKRDHSVVQCADFIAAVGNVGAGEDTLASYTAPLSDVYGEGAGWKGRFWGTTANNANAKTLRLRCIEGANNTVAVTFALTANEDGRWVMDFEVKRNTATLFSSVGTVTCGPAAGPTSRIGTSMVGASGATLTFANACELRLTGEATANNDITVQNGTIYRYNFAIG